MKTRIYKSIIFQIAFLAVAAILISSCKKSDPEPIVYGNAKVRVVNTVSGSQPQDFYQEGTKISTTPVAYSEASANYYTVVGGPSLFGFKDAGTTNATAAGSFGLQPDGLYTMFYYKNGTGVGQVAVAPDDNTAPAAGKAKIRFVNFGFALNNALNIKYNTSGAVVLNGLGTAFSDYILVDANGATDLAVTVVGSPTWLTIPGSNFASGKIYAVWFDAVTATTVNYHVVLQN
jgi:hypothetical protein